MVLLLVAIQMFRVSADTTAVATVVLPRVANVAASADLNAHSSVCVCVFSVADATSSVSAETVTRSRRQCVTLI